MHRPKVVALPLDPHTILLWSSRDIIYRTDVVQGNVSSFLVGPERPAHTLEPAWEQAEVMYIADYSTYDILIRITLASSTALLTFSIGITGTILDSRPIITVYATVLWPALIYSISSQSATLHEHTNDMHSHSTSHGVGCTPH